MEILRLTRESVTLAWPHLNQKLLETWWKAWISTSSTLKTCWAKTVSRCTPLSWTLMFIWSERTRPVLLTSVWRSTWTVRAGQGHVSPRRPGCGIAVTPSGSMCTSTVQEHRPHHCSELNQAQLCLNLKLFGAFILQSQIGAWILNEGWGCSESCTNTKEGNIQRKKNIYKKCNYYKNVYFKARLNDWPHCQTQFDPCRRLHGWRQSAMTGCRWCML